MPILSWKLPSITPPVVPPVPTPTDGATPATSGTLVTFRDAALLLAPRWLRRHFGGRLLYGIGVQYDAIIDGLVKGISQRFPTISQEDALPYLARERGIERGFEETSESYRVRLLRWLDDRKLKGNPFCLMRQLQSYFSPHLFKIRVVNQAGAWATLDTDGSVLWVYPSERSWDWDTDDEAWGRYWVILYPPTGFWSREGTLGEPGVYGDAGTLGSTITQAQVASMRAIVSAWTAAHSRCRYIIVAFDPTSFDPSEPGGNPDGTWGEWMNFTRLDTARYIYVPTKEDSQ